MCGIFGYLGPRNPAPLLLDGLARLEYRGYDSAGLALKNHALTVVKTPGKLANLRAAVAREQPTGTLGIAHTRWATHGEPTCENAHPHTDCTGNLALIHNGIIENHRALREALEAEGHRFASKTDTEVLAHLIERFHADDLMQAVRKALHLVRGSYAIAVISAKEECIVAARASSPLLVGVGDGEWFLSSDPASVVAHTKRVMYLDDGEVARVSAGGCAITNLSDEPIDKEIATLALDISQIEKGGFETFMQKEIFEQPESLRTAMRGRLVEAGVMLGGLRLEDGFFDDVARIVLVACGTSYYSGLVGQSYLEHFAKIPTVVEYASEFRYRDPLITPQDLVIAISQSGETIDTLEALREAKRRGAKVLGVVNVVGSSISREANRGVYLHAGPEIGVASTKASTCQLAVLYQIALALAARRRTLEPGRIADLARALKAVPAHMEAILSTNATIQALAARFAGSAHALYLGRGLNYPVALEGALKLKEISYVHAEGYPAAEMKHGPIALIDENMPVIVLATRDKHYDKILSNIQEVLARKGRVLAIATDGDTEIRTLAEHVLYVPACADEITPFLTVLPIQLFAYHMARLRGCDVDQPRNLAKSVTVE